MEQLYNLPTPSPTRVKSVTDKRLLLRRSQDHFRCACDQIILLNRKMEGVLFRYHAAKTNSDRVFWYKFRLRLVIVGGIRNMFYEYANLRASEIVKFRRELFGEIVEIVSDDTGAQYFADDDDRSYTDSELPEYSEDFSESVDDSPENDEDSPEDHDITTDNNEESIEFSSAFILKK
ncbi:hypothetical protein MAR_014604 [Mya arenaria]|uniref:Uncharacterized protein n=1 Tax=Mya arenaria TaxID=6604 RepID=A0ABY7G387_MYAAR|nr:hypothetical protein MAR_014604 [Mya arenaria]